MWWLATMALAGDPYGFDYEKNLIMSDTYPGPVLIALGERGKKLDACLVDAGAAFDRIGRISAADIEVAEDGSLVRFGFGNEELASVDACLSRALEGIELPEGRHRSGIVKVKRTAVASARTSVTTEADGIRAVLTAAPKGTNNVEVTLVVTPEKPWAFGNRAVVMNAAVYRPDGTSTHVASWTIPNDEVRCIEAGQSTTLTGELMASDMPRAGEVARIPVMLQHGPCGTEADGTRTVVGGVELEGGAATVWSAADLDSRPEPFR